MSGSDIVLMSGSTQITNGNPQRTVVLTCAAGSIAMGGGFTGSGPGFGALELVENGPIESVPASGVFDSWRVTARLNPATSGNNVTGLVYAFCIPL